MIYPFVFFLTVLLGALVIETIFQHFWIAQMLKLKIEQVTKMYGPSWHDKAKMGTPSMGGIVFVLVFLVMFIPISIYYAFPKDLVLITIAYPLAAACVGFADDWLKHKSNSSEGLKSLQKLWLQILITIPLAWYVVDAELPLIGMLVAPRWLGIILVTFMGVGILNAVNVTDGLDGLATGCVLISFAGIKAFLVLDPVSYAALAINAGICLGFLWHNANPAKVFMGDCGSHYLGAVLFVLCLNCNAIIYLVPISFIFAIEIVSVAIQIFAIRKLHKKVFLMSPIHHHFELKGWGENQVVMRFWIIHLLGMTIGTIILAALEFYI